MRLKIVSVRTNQTSNQTGSGILMIVFLTYVKIASGKLNALAKIAPFIGLYKRRIPRNYLNKHLAYTRMSFFNSQFNYCPLIWMCHRRTINRLLERCLRVIYSDKQSPFSELLEKNDSVSIHMRNIESLAISRQQKDITTKYD